MKKVIKSEWFGIVSLAIILTPQIAHSVYIFSINSQYDNPWFAWCYAIGVDLAILIFTVSGWKNTALAYLGATLATNLVYFWSKPHLEISILISVLQAGTIYAFSHLYTKQNDEKEKASQAKEKPSHSERYEMAQAQGIYIEAHPYKCPQCNYTTATAKKLNGHISGHKQKGEWFEDRYEDWQKQNHKRALIARKLDIAA
ncbi:MAG: C2H2-type zinc finger protein [Ekhidna sp.]